jgi:small GTP-binding protein
MAAIRVRRQTEPPEHECEVASCPIPDLPIKCAYFGDRLIMTDPQDHVAFKAVLLGESGVGKTSLVTRWVSGVFSMSATPTIGANHQTKYIQLDSVKVEMSIWDTAGQEEFQSLTPLYARSAAVAVLCTAIDLQRSFEKIDVWLDLLKQANEVLPPVVLVVNKIDLEPRLIVRQEELTLEYGSRFAGLFFVSALTNDGVDNMLHHVAEVGYRFAVANHAPLASAPLDDSARAARSCC